MQGRLEVILNTLFIRGTKLRTSGEAPKCVTQNNASSLCTSTLCANQKSRTKGSN